MDHFHIVYLSYNKRLQEWADTLTGIRKINRGMIDVSNNMPYDTKFQQINLASSTILWLGLGLCDWLTGH